MGQVTTITITIILHVNLRYNERGDFLQGCGQVTWLEYTFIGPPTCHVKRMINKNTLKGKNKNKMVQWLVQNDVVHLFNYKDLV